MQDKKDDSDNGETHTNDVHRETRELRKVKCFRCQEFGYFYNKCPNGANVRDTHTNAGTKETSINDMEGLMPTLEIDAGTDYLFEGFTMVTNGYTKSYLKPT